jgi:hypothetical protein
VVTSIIKLMIAFRDPDLDLEQLDREALRLISELKGSDEIEKVERVPEQNIISGSKSLGGFLAGLLAVEVNSRNVKSIFRFLNDRLGGKPIELEVEAAGKRLKVSASSREELESAIKAAQDFIISG